MSEGKFFDRVSLVVLDGVGCGEAQDTASAYPEDEGANSLRNAALQFPIDSPPLQRMGLEAVPGLEEMQVRESIPVAELRGASGALQPDHFGNGSPEGHQGLAGLRAACPYEVFNRTGIPADIIRDIEESVARVLGRPVRVIRYPGTDDINGEKFIAHPEIGARHLASADPSTGPLLLPVYASSDSLVQVAAHQGVVPQRMIEVIGETVRREVFDGKGRRVARVIMRPFVGEPGNFQRISADRRDYAASPDGPTLIDHLTERNLDVFGIGKAPSMFNGQGFPKGRTAKMKDDPARIQEVLRRMREESDALVFTNLVATDENFGHTRKPREYLAHVEAMGTVLGEIQAAMGNRDLLIVSSDHGNDPTCSAHTNHTREDVPLLVFSPSMRGFVELGVRQSFGDVAATIAENFGVDGKLDHGESFLRNLVA